MNTVNVKMFFDDDRIKRAVDSATRKNLSKAGAFVRTAAKSSIRKRKAISAPGQPPTSRTGLLKRFIFFGYDANRKTVVVGPMRLRQKIGKAPEALEHGGPSTILGGRGKRRVKRQIIVEARPFMGPAMKQEAPKFPNIWANSVR